MSQDESGVHSDSCTSTTPPERKRSTPVTEKELKVTPWSFFLKEKKQEEEDDVEKEKRVLKEETKGRRGSTQYSWSSLGRRRNKDAPPLSLAIPPSWSSLGRRRSKDIGFARRRSRDDGSFFRRGSDSSIGQS